MAITLNSRKPVDKLSPSDFKAFPIWEFASDEEGVDGQDETWVRPVKGEQIPLDAYSQLVAADFTTPNERRFEGFMNVTTADQPVDIRSGAIVDSSFYCVLPTMTREEAIATKRDWSHKDRDDLARTLQLIESSLFPLHYELRVRIHGEKTKRSGKVV